jgi:hypothetical protein
VILNDPKSSTYKLALLRVIARVSDSTAGLAMPAGSVHCQAAPRWGVSPAGRNVRNTMPAGPDIELKHGRATAAMHKQELSIGRRPGCFRAGLC